MFWLGQVLVGGVIPLVILFSGLGKSRALVTLAAILVVLGGLAQVYVIIIGGQAYPMPLYPGKEIVSSSFFDGVVTVYQPTLAEIVLGIGGFGLALFMAAFAMRVLPFLPQSLSDAAADPHYKADAAKPQAATA
jgi:molybdopterin-containing oxidoreductase family membrane subunit